MFVLRLFVCCSLVDLGFLFVYCCLMWGACCGILVVVGCSSRIVCYWLFVVWRCALLGVVRCVCVVFCCLLVFWLLRVVVLLYAIV